jgi:hypothetical protein
MIVQSAFRRRRIAIIWNVASKQQFDLKNKAYIAAIKKSITITFI